MELFCPHPTVISTISVSFQFHSLEHAVMEAMQPYAVRVTDGVAANLLEVIALPDGQLQ